MARWLDSLGVIFPFEVEAFADTDLDVRFLGIPFWQKTLKTLSAMIPKGRYYFYPVAVRLPRAASFPSYLTPSPFITESILSPVLSLSTPEKGCATIFRNSCRQVFPGVPASR